VSARVYIGIGSNLGDRLGYCRAALDRLARLPVTTLRRVSPFMESAPQEGVEGGMFLNAVAEISTGLSARQLLGQLQEIEVALGRPAGHEPRSARSMDLDILLYGELVVNAPDLVIPHPGMARRRFVLAPLVALAPAVRHPVLGVAAAELLRRLGPGAPASLAGSPR
jgi:2-amino-4-hydroxy-6-hydroxymethyldihydropteridine diphosphokinase